MALHKILSGTTRLLFWPLFIIVALNIESLATDNGLATIIADRWHQVRPMLEYFYSIITSPYLLYPSIFFLGAAAQSHAVNILRSLSHSDGNKIRRATKINATGLAGSFNKKGASRHFHSKTGHGALLYMNDLLEGDNLPIISRGFLEKEKVNKAIGQYLQAVSSGDREIAMRVYTQIVLPIIDEEYPPQSPTENAT